MVTQNIQEVKNFIRANFDEGKKIISIDGLKGVLKSTLADSFRDNNQIEIIHFEDYWVVDPHLYLDVFKFNKLKKTIIKALDSGKDILMEGLCLIQILENISLESQYKVYIKKLELGEWGYEKYLDENKTTEEIFVEDDEYMKVNIFEGSYPNAEDDLISEDFRKKRKGIFYDLVRYHRDYKPQDNSDIIFERL